MPEIEIRPAVAEDIEKLSVFEHSYYSEYVWQMGQDIGSNVTKTDFQKTRLPRKVFVPYPRKREEIFGDLAKAEAFLVAALDNVPVAYVKVQAEPESRIAKVTDLVVSTSMRRQGIASGLLFACMDLISYRKFYALILEMQSKNDPVITMAAKLGFKFCGFRDYYFPTNELALFFSRFAH